LLRPPSPSRTIGFVSDTGKLRALPAVHEVLAQLSPSLEPYPHALLVAEIRGALEEMRAEILGGQTNGPAAEVRVERRLAALERPSLRLVINATWRGAAHQPGTRATRPR